jgi:hypothetical protein
MPDLAVSVITKEKYDAAHPLPPARKVPRNTKIEHSLCALFYKKREIGNKFYRIGLGKVCIH